MTLFLLAYVSDYANQPKADLNFLSALMDIIPADIKVTWKKNSKSISLPQPIPTGRMAADPQPVACKAESEKL